MWRQPGLPGEEKRNWIHSGWRRRGRLERGGWRGWGAREWSLQHPQVPPSGGKCSKPPRRPSWDGGAPADFVFLLPIKRPPSREPKVEWQKPVAKLFGDARSSSAFGMELNRDVSEMAWRTVGQDDNSKLGGVLLGNNSSSPHSSSAVSLALVLQRKRQGAHLSSEDFRKNYDGGALLLMSQICGGPGEKSCCRYRYLSNMYVGNFAIHESNMGIDANRPGTPKYDGLTSQQQQTNLQLRFFS